MKLLNKKTIEVLAPISGTVVAQKDIKDAAFSEEMIGAGLAITPENNNGKQTAYSPVSGIVKVAFHTGHAFGIETKEGPSILVHIGINTVEMNGKGFNATVKQGIKIKHSDALGSFDVEEIINSVISSDVVVLATNDSSKG
ncbi:MAG: PTS glucose transporter subunit IIA [Tenericutes bacterium]|nr:MAG: PTS glucose transporter subunit IIA [Mycoplasmatota bacterium]